MRTTVTKRAQTVVPAALRERYGIQGGDFLEWIDDGQVIKVTRVYEYATRQDNYSAIQAPLDAANEPDAMTRKLHTMRFQVYGRG